MPVQFAVGSVLALVMWTLNLHEKPKVDKDLVGCLSRIFFTLTINVPVPTASLDWAHCRSKAGAHYMLKFGAGHYMLPVCHEVLLHASSPLRLGRSLQILSVLPLAAVHTLGNLLTNVSLGQVAVSFTHTIKARASHNSKR